VSDQEKAAKRAQWEEINRAKAAAKQKEQSAPEKAEPRASATHKQFQAIRGTRDLLPPDTGLWNRVEQTAHEVFSTYGYGEIRPPIFEQTELFARSIGQDTDVVSKEMYSFEDHEFPELARTRTVLSSQVILPGDRHGFELFIRQVQQFAGELKSGIAGLLISRTPENERALSNLQNGIPELTYYYSELSNANLPPNILQEYRQRFALAVKAFQAVLREVTFGDEVTLRPEATASVCRAYIEHNMQQLPQPVKLYYTGPMFRRERPQKGRYRQFYQIGAEILGGPDAPAIDAELIEMLMTFFQKCGLEGTTLDINSIGHAADNCRRGYVAKLREELLKVKDKLGADSQRRIETNPLRVLDSKLEHEQPIIETLPRIADHLCDECKTHYAAVKRDLDLRGVTYRENWRLVRGLDYYMRTTFEITAQGLGSQNAVCGGGRYDGLVELLGGPPTKGIGFAIGEDRLILSLQEGGKAPAEQGPDVFIAWMGQNAYATAIRAAKTLRNAGFRVELPATELKFGKALERASKLGSRFALILGDNEVQSGEWTLKNLANAEQQKLTEQALLEYLQKL
jgi:histidyl-tRNA synthetase